MLKVVPDKLEQHRVRFGPLASTRANGMFGAFIVFGPCGQELRIITNASHEDSAGWEHVSVSTVRRCPNWLEMCFVKDLFWGPEECVIQFHPPKSEYVNHHPYCLHLWKPPFDLPTPPTELVGPKK